MLIFDWATFTFPICYWLFLKYFIKLSSSNNSIFSRCWVIFTMGTHCVRRSKTARCVLTCLVFFCVCVLRGCCAVFPAFHHRFRPLPHGHVWRHFTRSVGLVFFSLALSRHWQTIFGKAKSRSTCYAALLPAELAN